MASNYVAEYNVVASVPYWYLLQPGETLYTKDNGVGYNIMDTAAAYPLGYSEGKNTIGATVTAVPQNWTGENVLVSPGAWPAEGLEIIGNAGLQPAYHSQRSKTIRIEAENFNNGGAGVSYHDLTSGNIGTSSGDPENYGDYSRENNNDVDIDFCDTCSNDQAVSHIQTGEWLMYYIDVADNGNLDFRFSVGTLNTSSGIQVFVDGVSKGTASLPNTGDKNVYATASLSGVPLTAGSHLVKLLFTGDFNFDYFTYTTLP